MPAVVGDRVAGKRSRLVYRSDRRNHIHDLFSAAVCADRHPAADDLAKRRQIRRHMKISLRPADSKTKTGDYLIKNQQCPVIFCDFSQKFQKSRLRQNDSHIGSHRLHDDRSDLFSLRLKELLHRSGWLYSATSVFFV